MWFRRCSGVLVILISVVFSACGAGETNDQPARNTENEVTPEEAKAADNVTRLDEWVTRLEIKRDNAKPPQFSIHCWADMRTTGYTPETDAVDISDGRIVAKITGNAPDVAGQAITPTRMTVNVGTLGIGVYVFELWFREVDNDDYELKEVLWFRAD